MADRTVRAVFEARVATAKRNIKSFGQDVEDTGKQTDGLRKDLKELDGLKAEPDIDVEIGDAKKRLGDLTAELADLKGMEASPEVDLQIEQVQGQIKDVRGEIKSLTAQKAEVRVEASIKDARKRLSAITQELGELRTLEASPEVDVRIKDAQKRMRSVRGELRDLQRADAEMQVTADTSRASDALDGLADDAAAAGEEGGESAGANLASGLVDAVASIPIAGAVVGVGAAIAGGILLGIKDGLSVEAGRDFFSAQTGLDPATSDRFGRAAGEAYAQAWGDSVEANLDTASMALRAGIIDSSATDAEIENVIAKLTGIQELFDYEISMAVQGVGNLMKTGLVRDADQAFDLIVASSQKLPSDDLIETMNEYSNQFSLLGLEAEDAFGLIVQGAEAGARDTDKVADALKELGNFAREGLEPAREAMQKLGLDADETVDAFNEGGPKARAAIGDVLDALRDLDKQGGNTQEVVAALFGGPGEDLGAALYALDLDDVAESLGGVEGAAGAADRALKTMHDNAAADVEKAKRDIEVAADGIKGALAAAFGDDISDAAEWVSKNREPLMRFFLDAINAALDAGDAFAEFGASVLETIAAVADGIAGIPFIGDDMREAMGEVSASAREGADAIRTNVPDALDDVRDSVNEWAAPELMKARVHDATVAMSSDMDTFSAKVDQSGGTVTINGDKVNAEQALAVLTENINKEDGTVTINGDRVPAEEALDVLMQHVSISSGSVTVGGDTSTGRAAVDGLVADAGTRRAAISVDADTAAAEAALASVTRRRYVELGVRVSGSTGRGGMLAGLHSGGWVPGTNPGYDNVLWPLHSGGQVMQQPLTGGEYVVNNEAARVWGPLLQWMNAGGQPGAGSAGAGASHITTAHIENLHGLTLEDAMREAWQLERKAALSRRNT